MKQKICDALAWPRYGGFTRSFVVLLFIVGLVVGYALHVDNCLRHSTDIYNNGLERGYNKGLDIGYERGFDDGVEYEMEQKYFGEEINYNCITYYGDGINWTVFQEDVNDTAYDVLTPLYFDTLEEERISNITMLQPTIEPVEINDSVVGIEVTYWYEVAREWGFEDG